MQYSKNINPHNRLQKLRAFCHAAQTGSITKAGTRLSLSQPSVSLLIKSLEEDLDMQLFERHGPRIKLTAEGKTLLDTALPLVEGLDHLPDLVAARLGKIEYGNLDIAAGESTILYLLADYIKRFNDSHPKINLHLHNVTGRDGMTMLRDGEVDLAIGSMIDIPDDITFLPIFTFDPMLITALSHPLAKKKSITLKDISPFGLILPPRHLSTWHIVDLVFQQHGIPYHVVLEAGGWEVVKKFVELDMGISIVTSICLTGREKLAAKPLNNFFPQRTYGAVMRKSKLLSPQAKAFLAMLDTNFQGKLADGNVIHQPNHSGRKHTAIASDFTGHDKSLA